MNALWKKRKKGNMTEIKEALFDEEPEKRKNRKKPIRIWSLCLGKRIK